MSTINIEDVSLSLRGSPKRPKLAYSYEDVNSDGYVDIIAFFSIQDLVKEGVLTEDRTSLTVSAKLYNGQPIQGVDSINIVPPKRSAKP